MNQFNELPNDSAVAVKVIEAQSATEKARLDRGWVGAIFGSRDHVPNNVAAIVAVVAVALLAGILVYGDDSSQFSREKAVAVITSIVTLVLGFLFGRSSRE